MLAQAIPSSPAKLFLLCSGDDVALYIMSTIVTSLVRPNRAGVVSSWQLAFHCFPTLHRPP